MKVLVSSPCTQTDPEVFFPTSPALLVQAKRICGFCTRQRACLLEGQAAGAIGVWGGHMLRDGVIDDRPLAPERATRAA